MSTTRSTPPTLSSAAARSQFEERREPVFLGAINTVDQLAALYEGLQAVRESQSPLETREANALAYRQRYDAAVARAENLVRAPVERCVDFEASSKAAAMKAAGIAADPPRADEIRTALRSMSQADRDRAVTQAMDRGDAAVIAAIIHAPSPIVVGEFSIPLETMTAHFLDKANPHLAKDAEDFETAVETVKMAWDGFQRGARSLRDLPAEGRAEEGQARASAAAGRLSAVMQGVTGRGGQNAA